MIPDHEAIQETLAAHALHALDEEEAVRAEQAIAEHVPHCAQCLALAEGFHDVTGHLALLTRQARPPRALEARIRREVGGPKASPWMRGSAAAAAVVLVTGLALWNAHLATRVSQAEARQVKTTEVLATVSHPRSQIVPLAAETPEATPPVSLSATYIPGHLSLYLFGSMPDPSADRVYQVWLVRGERFLSAGVFTPERGVVILRLQVNPAAFEGLLITEEPKEGSAQPSNRHVVVGSLNA